MSSVGPIEFYKMTFPKNSNSLFWSNLPRNKFRIILHLPKSVVTIPKKVIFFFNFHEYLWSLGNMNAVVAYATCAKIWNHPDLLYNSAMKDTDDAEDFEGLDLEDFSMDGISTGPRKSKKTKKVSKISSESTEWAKNCGILQNHIPGDVMAGYKVPILLSILAKGLLPTPTQNWVKSKVDGHLG